MANNTLFCRKSKDDENNNGRRSGFSASDANDLRRSARKTLSGMFSIPSSTRKSKRLLKRTPPTLAVRRKFEGLELPIMSSPLRRSERIKKQSALSGQERDEKLTPSKRKENMMVKLSDVSAGRVNEDNCTQVANAASRQCECKVGDIIGTCKARSKRTRLDHDPIVSYNAKESINPSTAEDINVDKRGTLAIIGPQSGNEDKEGLISNSNDSIGQLREKLPKDIAYGCRSDSFKFVEYWVPVQISQVQLEQYCAALVSNTSVLCSTSTNDHVGALQDLLISTRKCCNHPYVVDPFLQTLLTKGLQEAESPDIGIKASGKLQALDSMLMELKKNGLRVLILFQSIGGSARDSTGDILDDFLHQKFGSDAYERVDKCLAHSKKLAALNLFNNKDNGRFIFLLDACACVPSIKLSSIDIVIIFDSDWNPTTDIRSLQRITLDSRSEQIKIFRLYSCFTVEEKALILAKQDKTLDSNLQSISWSISHRLLMWGASCLLDNLRLFHDGKSSSSCFNFSFENSEQLLLEEALREFSSVLLQDNGDNDTCGCSVISKVQLNEGTHCKNFALLGERKLGSPDERLPLPHTFWTKLLQGKVFQWKFSCVSSQRSRKRAQHFGGSVNTLNLGSEEIARKHKKMINSVIDKLPSNFQSEKSSSRNKEGDKIEYEKIRKLSDEQKSLHLLLKPEIAKLSEILLLPDNVKTLMDNFFEYIMNNHHIYRESESILQAFQISLCWTAASLLKHKINHGASLMLARQHLKFDCGEEEADYIYSILRCLKTTFLHRAGNFNVISSPKVSESPTKVKLCTGVVPKVELAAKDIAKSIKEIQKKCQKKLRKLLLKQHEEINKLNAVDEEKKAVLREKYKTESAAIRCCFPNNLMRLEKLKIVDEEYAKRIAELECQHGVRIKDIEAEQLAARQNVQCREAVWIEGVKCWAQKGFKIVLSKEFVSGLKYSKTNDQAQPRDGSKNVGLMSDHVDEGPITTSYAGSGSRNDDHTKAEIVCENQGHIISMHSYSKEHNSDEAPSMTYRVEGRKSSSCSCREDIAVLVLPSSEGEICDGKTSNFSIQEVAVEVHNTSNLNDGWDEVLSSTEEELCGTILSKPGCGFSLEVNGSSDGMNASMNSRLSQDPFLSANAVSMLNCENSAQIHEANESSGLNKFDTLNSPFSDERTADGATGIVSEREVLVGTVGTVSLTSCPKNAIPPKPPSSVEQTSDGGGLNVLNRELSPRPFETGGPSHSSNFILVTNSPSSEQQTGGEITIKVLDTSHRVAQCHNDIEQQTDTILLDKITSSDQQEGVSRTMNENSMSQEISVLSPEVTVNEVPQVLCSSLFTSHQMLDEDVRVGEMQNSSQQIERASSQVDKPAIQSNPKSLVMETTVQVQQLLFDQFSFFNQDTQPNHDSLLMNSPEQVQLLCSAKSHLSNQDPTEEVQNSSQEVERLSNLVDIVLANQSNHESLVREPIMEEHQLPKLKPPSSNMDIIGEMQNPSHQAERVISPVGAVSSPEQVQLLYSIESPLSNQDLATEVRSSCQKVKQLSNPIDIALVNQSNHESLVIEPLIQEQQLPTPNPPSSNPDIIGEMRNSSRQVGQVTSPVGVVSFLEQVQLLHSTESLLSNQDSVEEVQNYSQEVERLPNPVDVVLANQSNHESLIMEHFMQEQQLPTSNPLSSNQDLVGEVQNPSHQVEQVTGSIGDVFSLEQVQLLHSAASPLSNLDPTEEVRNYSQEVEQLSNPIDVVLANQSNHESLVMEPHMEEQQLPTSKPHFSNQDIVGEMQNPSNQVEQVTGPAEVVSSIRLHHESQVMDNLELVQELLFIEHPSSNQNTVEELQNSSQHVELVSCLVDETPPAQANSEILVVEPVEHVQVSLELPSCSLHSSNLPLAPGIGRQQINEDTISSHVSQALVEVPLQLDSLTPVGCGTYGSNTINRSTPLEINNHPIQIATQSSSRMPPPLYLDPIQIEMEKLHKEMDQANKDHKNVKLQLKSDCDKEVEEVYRKYNAKLQEIEVEHQQTKKNLHANINVAQATKKLAEAVRLKDRGPELTDELGMRKDANFTQQFVQPSGQQSAIRLSPVSCRPLAANLQSGFIMTSSSMVLPIQSTHNTRRNFFDVSRRPPHANTISSSSGYLLAGGNIHASALRPQTYRSLMTIPSTSFPTVLPGMSNRLTPSNIPATSLSFPHFPPQPTPPTYQLDPHNRGHRPEITVGFPFVNYGVNNHIGVTNQFGINLRNVWPHM